MNVVGIVFIFTGLAMAANALLYSRELRGASSRSWDQLAVAAVGTFMSVVCIGFGVRQLTNHEQPKTAQSQPVLGHSGIASVGLTRAPRIAGDARPGGTLRLVDAGGWSDQNLPEGAQARNSIHWYACVPAPYGGMHCDPAVDPAGPGEDGYGADSYRVLERDVNRSIIAEVSHQIWTANNDIIAANNGDSAAVKVSR